MTRSPRLLVAAALVAVMSAVARGTEVHVLASNPSATVVITLR